jgi:predicted ATPase
MTTPKTHLKRVQISGFKSIASLDLIMNPINILIGANGSGKSNFISLFSFLRHLSVWTLIQLNLIKYGQAILPI